MWRHHIHEVALGEKPSGRTALFRLVGWGEVALPQQELRRQVLPWCCDCLWYGYFSSPGRGGRPLPARFNASLAFLTLARAARSRK